MHTYMEFKHTPVLFEETLDLLALKDTGIWVDGTLGGGGHSFGMLSRTKEARLIGIDRDAEAICAAKKRLSEFTKRVTFVNDNFSHIKEILKELNIDKIDGAVLDLGISSYQIDNAERGFSYMHNAVLDMRMDQKNPTSARDIVNEYTKDELSRIFFDYGEERWSKRIAGFIEEKRKDKPIETTFELVDIIKAAIPKGAREEGSHPAKRVFQALRIETNGELEILKRAVCDFADMLKPGARLAVITFHSLEDRIVKQTFKELESGCTCPADFPVCVCGKKPEIKIITKKPILPQNEEIGRNPRAKSAKLRAAEKI